MREQPLLYADISSLTQLNKLPYLQKVQTRPEFKGRLLYGTDYPLMNMPVLVSAWYHPFRLSPAQILRIARTPNPWDRDVALKHALGMPADVWTRAETVLHLAPP